MRPSDVLRLQDVRQRAADGRARQSRIAAGVTLAEVGAVCNVSATAVLRWERGDRVPRGDAALRYARLLERLDQQVTLDGSQ